MSLPAAAKKHVDVPAGRIAYTETGPADAPVALYVHGVIVNGHLWRHQLTGFAGIRRNIAVDLLGHGDSIAADGQPVTFTAQADALRQVLDALHVSTVDLVANDSGTGIAQIFAAASPHRLRTLVLTNGDVHDNWPPAEFAAFTDRVKAGELASIVRRFAADHDYYRSADGLRGAYQYPDAVADADIDAYIGPYLANPAQIDDLERFILAFDPAQTVAIAGQLRILTVPTLVAWGTGDIFFDPSWARWLASTIPGVRRTLLLDGAALLLPEERAADLNPAIAEHWAHAGR